MFDLSRVTSVYSGRKGCACGCRGKYSYAFAHKNTRPSYYCGNDGVSDRSVKTIVNKVTDLIQNHGNEIQRIMSGQNLEKDGTWLSIDLKHDRTYTLRFKG